MFRGAGSKKTEELNEDDMASRLQLEIGICDTHSCCLYLILFSQNVTDQQEVHDLKTSSMFFEGCRSTIG